MLRRPLLALLLAVGCSPKGPEAELRFEGQPPPGAYAEDTRVVVVVCPACRRPAAEHRCGASVHIPDRAPCGFCRGTKACVLCAAFETSGLCRYCDGEGKRGAEECFACRGSGACAACGGSASCDACGGTGSIALPWVRPPARRGMRPKGKTMALPRGRNDSPLVWVGEPFSFPKFSDWTVTRAEQGRRVEVAKVPRYGSFTPAQPGCYVALAEGHSIFLDAVGVDVSTGAVEERGSARRVSPTIAFNPPLCPETSVRWELRGTTGPPFSLEGPGRYEIWPTVRVPGVPESKVHRPAVYYLSAVSIDVPWGGHVRSGHPEAFEARSEPPLPDETTYGWTRTDSTGKSETLASKKRWAEIEFPGPGKYRVQVRAAGNTSSPVEVSAFRLTLVGPDGRALPEARLAVLEGKETPGEKWLAGCAERLRVVVEDHAPGAPNSLSVSLRSSNGASLNESIYHLVPGGPTRATRSFVLFSDPADCASFSRSSEGGHDDPAVLAVPRGRLDIRYRDSMMSVDVGPMIVREVPVRVIAVGAGFPPKKDLESTLDRRLEEASSVWAPFGRRFVRASLDVAASPLGLLLVRGRSAGVDARGQSSRIAVKVDGAEVSAPAAWKGGAGAAARQLVSSLESSFRVDLFEKILPSDREAVVLRIRHRDGTPVLLERIRDREDVSLSIEPLEPDLSKGCEAAAERSQVSLEETAILLGLRGTPSEEIHLFLVPRLRTPGDQPLFSKAYRRGDFSAPLSGAVVAAWAIADGSEKYPYGLAQALGYHLLPAGWSPRPEDTLFDPALCSGPSANIQKRVGRLTGARVREGGRIPAAENVDSTKGIEQGGK